MNVKWICEEKGGSNLHLQNILKEDTEIMDLLNADDIDALFDLNKIMINQL